MEKPEARQNVSFLWNDVASLADDNCSFVICKSMVTLSPELAEMKQLEKINIRSITRSIDASRAGGQEINGEIAVEISYETTQGEEASADFTVPFNGSYYGTRERSNRPQVVYVDGQAVGFDHLLLETVLAVPAGSTMLRGGQRVVGEFKQEQRVILPEELPAWAQIIGTQVTYDTKDWQYQDGELALSGQQQIKLLYAAEASGGERVMFYQLPLNFRAQLPVDEPLSEEQSLSISYQSLTAHLLNEREAVIHMNGVVRAAGTRSQAQAAPEVDVVEAILPEESEPEPIREPEPEINREPEPVREPEPAPPEAFQAPEAEPPVRPQQQPMNAKGPARPPRRPSKRDNLLKYMRSLDRGVRTPQMSRSIAFNQQAPEAPEDTQEPSIEAEPQ